jgi:transposase
MKTAPPTYPASPQPAADPPQPAGNARAVDPQRDRKTAEQRAALVTRFKILKACGLSDDMAATRLRASLRELRSLERRFDQGGVHALLPERRVPKPPVTADWSGVKKARPRRPPARRRRQTNYRALVLGRFLQLRAQGASYPEAARHIGCGVTTLWHLHKLFRAGGLLALEILPSTGRPRKQAA